MNIQSFIFGAVSALAAEFALLFLAVIIIAVVRSIREKQK